MDRKKAYIIIISLFFLSLPINNYIGSPSENQKNYFSNLKTSDSIAIYSPTSSTVVDLTISTLLTVEWGSGVAVMCEIYLCEFLTEVEYLGSHMNGGRIQPGYINSDTVDLSSDHRPYDYYSIKLVDINDQWNYDYSDFFTILNDAYVPPQDDNPPPSDPDPYDYGGNDVFIYLLIYMVLIIGGLIVIGVFVKKMRKSNTTVTYKPKMNKKPKIDHNKIRQIKKVILDLGFKVSFLEIEEIIERTNLYDKELIENVIRNMIKNSEIHAEYFPVSKAIAFDLQANVEEIDKLMKIYRDWEKKVF